MCLKFEIVLDRKFGYSRDDPVGTTDSPARFSGIRMRFSASHTFVRIELLCFIPRMNLLVLLCGVEVIGSVRVFIGLASIALA